MSNNNILVYKQLSDGYYVGNNETTHRNGLQPNVDIPSKLVIPYQHNSISIDYIGQFAFYQCQSIVEVIVEARIKGIHRCAFFGCQSLISINIPSTCRFIYGGGLDGRLDPTNIIGEDQLTVVFEPFSVLNFFGEAAISNFEKITIYFFNEISATCDINFLCGLPLSNIKLYSKFSFDVCGFSTVNFPQREKTCRSNLNLAIFKLLCYQSLFSI